MGGGDRSLETPGNVGIDASGLSGARLRLRSPSGLLAAPAAPSKGVLHTDIPYTSDMAATEVTCSGLEGCVDPAFGEPNSESRGVEGLGGNLSMID